MSTPAVIIRHATVADLAEVTALVRQLNEEEGYDVSASVEQLEEVLFNKRARVPMRAILAVSGKRTVGLVLFYWGFDTVSASYGYHLADIVVERQSRNQGLGSRMFAALADQCLREDGKWVSLTVLKQNERAQHFYRRCGMVEVAVNFYAIGPQALERVASKR